MSKKRQRLKEIKDTFNHCGVPCSDNLANYVLSYIESNKHKEDPRLVMASFILNRIDENTLKDIHKSREITKEEDYDEITEKNLFRGSSNGGVKVGQ